MMHLSVSVLGKGRHLSAGIGHIACQSCLRPVVGGFDDHASKVSG